MGKSSGGGSQTVTQLPWGQARQFGRQTISEAQRLANRDKLVAAPFQSGMTKDFIGGMAALGRDNPFTAQTMGNYADFMGANTNAGPVNLSGDTFGMDRISDFVMSKTLPQVAGMFGQGGFANSTMAQQTAADAVTNALTPFAQQQFNLDRGRMDENAYYNAALGERNIDRGLSRDLSGLGLAPTISGMQYADLQALGQAGGMRDAFVMAQRNNQGDNVRAATDLFTALGGMGGSQTSTGGGPGTLETLGGIGQLGVNAGIAGSLLGLGGGAGAAAGGAFGAGSLAAGPALAGLSSLGPLAPLAFCDRRLKADIEPTGATYRGVDLYTFRYLWDEPDVRRIGPMAQEVPAHARVTLPSGFLAVDMGAL